VQFFLYEIPGQFKATTVSIVLGSIESFGIELPDLPRIHPEASGLPWATGEGVARHAEILDTSWRLGRHGK
jgi:hypothetical protein